MKLKLSDVSVLGWRVSNCFQGKSNCSSRIHLLNIPHCKISEKWTTKNNLRLHDFLFQWKNLIPCSFENFFIYNNVFLILYHRYPIKRFKSWTKLFVLRENFQLVFRSLSLLSIDFVYLRVCKWPTLFLIVPIIFKDFLVIWTF